jgi:hypothetical protein
MKLILRAMIRKAVNEWRGWVTGEYWIEKDGGETECSGDGEYDHESYAKEVIANHYSDEAQQTLFRFFGLGPDGKDLPGNRKTKAKENRIEYPMEFSQCVDYEEVVRMMCEDKYPAREEDFMPDALMYRHEIRKFFQKYFEAVHVVNNYFGCWIVTDDIVKNIGTYLMNRSEEYSYDYNERDVLYLEEIGVKKVKEYKVIEFLVCDHATDLRKIQQDIERLADGSMKDTEPTVKNKEKLPNEKPNKWVKPKVTTQNYIDKTPLEDRMTCRQRERDNAFNQEAGWEDPLPGQFDYWFKGSKVVDKKGRPLVCHHGTPDRRRLDESQRFESKNNAYFFTPDVNVAKTYANPTRAWDYQECVPGVLSFFLKIVDPMIVDWRGQRFHGTQKVIEEAREKGHDGVIINNVIDNYSNYDINKRNKPTTVYVVFNRNQMKSIDSELFTDSDEFTASRE